ncbi:MAG: 3-phosphoshikimate 1-carboxyvinyltransferase [Lachnoclostridium sp.]|nr:3-phosphoshikimate 1-carboxyvinyltransferase [Lachnospira sp.]MCM1249326.1 3-phosphoshikimate 1-carboxyvinyltransferase [Lachnoclostridium sp.]
MKQTTYSVPELYSVLQASPFTDTLTVAVPGSKSITNRALLLATLADGISTLRGVLFSDDSRHFLKCIQDLGFETAVDEEAAVITVKGCGGRIPLQNARQYVGSAGTAARFLTACLGVSEGVYFMDASEQMRRRPMAPLLSSLKELGCEILYPEDGQEGFFPFTLRGHGFGKNEITVDIAHSSQFLSALLISSCLSKEDFTIHVQGTHGMAYIEMTCRMMAQFGVQTLREEGMADVGISYRTPAGQAYKALSYFVEPDASAACYFYACSPLLQIPVLVPGVHFDSLQGDVEFLHILERMGCTALETDEGILLKPPLTLAYHGITVDMSACSDQAITLAAIAPFADSPTTITGIGHIRFQECDRLNAIATELTRMGIRCDEGTDSLTIYPGVPEPCLVNTYDDHRMAMGLSLTGLRAPGIVIDNPGCCRKTFENYFEVLDKTVATIQKGGNVV